MASCCIFKWAAANLNISCACERQASVTDRGETPSVQHVIMHTDKELCVGCSCSHCQVFWSTSVINSMNGSFTCCRLPHIYPYRNACLPCCHVVWLWLDLKTKCVRLIKNKHTVAHSGNRTSNRFWRAQHLEFQVLSLCLLFLFSSVPAHGQ